MIAGVDFSSRAVDIVLLDEDTDAASWHRFDLEGADAFDRARSVGLAVPGRAMSFWDEILAVGIEDPRGYNAGSMYRVQGAVLSCVPAGTLVQPWVPSAWRKAVGLPGNASKDDVARFFIQTRVLVPGALMPWATEWPQDGMDAYCIALATRSLLQHGESGRMTDRQLPLEPTIRIDPTTLVEYMPGTDAICPADRGHDCGYPFCTCFQEDARDDR